MTEAVELLQQAATKGQHLPGQYNLRAYLLFSLGSVDEAAKVWGQGAKQARPPSSTLYSNQACALAKLGKYSESLTAPRVCGRNRRPPGCWPERFRSSPRRPRRKQSRRRRAEPFQDRPSGGCKSPISQGPELRTDHCVANQSGRGTLLSSGLNGCPGPFLVIVVSMAQ